MALERVVALVTVLLLVTGAGMMVAQRAAHDRWYYISEFGARGLSTEADFKLGFTVLSVGFLLAAWPLRRIRTKPFPAWITIALAASTFIVASQVNCTENCPGLGNPAATARDLVHIWFAIFGFVLGCLAMLQIAFTGSRRFRVVTVVAALAIGIISGTGGLLSLAGSTSELGAIAEHIAAGIGVLWIIGLVLVEANRYVPSTAESAREKGTADAGAAAGQPQTKGRAALSETVNE